MCDFLNSFHSILLKQLFYFSSKTQLMVELIQYSLFILSINSPLKLLNLFTLFLNLPLYHISDLLNLLCIFIVKRLRSCALFLLLQRYILSILILFLLFMLYCLQILYEFYLSQSAHMQK